MYLSICSSRINEALAHIKRKGAFRRSLHKNFKKYTEEEYFNVITTVRDLYEKGGLR